MRFMATLQYSDGSIREFSEAGSKSANTERNDWLTTISDVGSTAPEIPPVIKPWLEEKCELLDSSDLLVNPSSRPQPVTDVKHSGAGGPAIKKHGRPNSSKRCLQLAQRRIFEKFIFLRERSGE
jgi:hypothetical protein